MIMVVDYNELVDEAIHTGDVVTRAGDGEIPRIIALRTTNLNPKKTRPPRWSEQDDAFLRKNHGLLSENEIARRLGRTETAVRLRRKRDLGLPAATTDPRYWTANVVGNMLGIEGRKVVYWIDQGILQGDRIPFQNHRIRRVRRQVFKQWVINPQNWVYFDITKIRYAHILRLVSLRHERWGDDWWTSVQTAAFHNVNS